MSKRNRREHGRIISVETLTRGDALAADVAAGATSITLNDAGDFDEDGGWLYIGTQTVEYTTCDDDTGIIALAEPLVAPGEEGDPVKVWSDMYDEVVDYQLALVELDGEYDNPDPVVAEVAEGVGDLPEGDRGKAGESCTLKRFADDEWEVVGVGGRPRRSRGLRAESDDFYTLTASDIAAGVATIPLTHRPCDEWLILWWRTVAQEPTEYVVNYDQRTVTYPLDGFEAVGDRIWVHYAYRKDMARRGLEIPFGHIWKYENGLVGVGNDNVTEALGASTYAAPAFDDSAWATGPSAFGYGSAGFPHATNLGPQLTVWMRATGTTSGGRLRITAAVDWRAWLYIDGELAWSSMTAGNELGGEVPCPAGDHVFAVYGWDEPSSPAAVIGVAIKEIL